MVAHSRSLNAAISMTAKAPLAYEVAEAAPDAVAEVEADVAEPLLPAVAEPEPEWLELEVLVAVVIWEAIVAAIASAVAFRVPHCSFARHSACCSAMLAFLLIHCP